MLTIALAPLRGVMGQSSGEMQTFFSKDYAGISIAVSATKESVSGGNITIYFWINCTSVGVKVHFLNLSVYGFRGGREKTLLNATNVLANTPMIFNNVTEFNYSLSIPDDVWDATYGELYVDYAIVDLSLKYSPSFSMTIVKNAYLEGLEGQFRGMFGSYWQLNRNYTQLNQTYWELRQNYTGNMNEIDNTRRLAVILAITTVFFVATTIYLVMRKPRDYW
jgi:hypothetical protein